MAEPVNEWKPWVAGQEAVVVPPVAYKGTNHKDAPPDAAGPAADAAGLPGGVIVEPATEETH